MAYVVFAALGVAGLAAAPARPACGRRPRWLGGLALLQLATGLGNVLLGWPLVAAVLHTGGAAALAVVLTWALCESRACRTASTPVHAGSARAAPAEWEAAMTEHARCQLPATTARRDVLRQFYALTKPRVVQLIVFCALIGMVLAVPGVPRWPTCSVALLACVGIWLVAGAAAAFNCLVEKGIDAKMKRTAWRPTARGQLSDRQALPFSALLCAAGSALLWLGGQPADHVADLRHLRRLCGGLHRHPEAADAAEHRDRRRIGRHAAGAGLGRDDGRRRARGADPVPDHLPVDAAAFLGAGAVPRRGLPQGRACRCCR